MWMPGMPSGRFSWYRIGLVYPPTPSLLRQNYFKSPYFLHLGCPAALNSPPRSFTTIPFITTPFSHLLPRACLSRRTHNNLLAMPHGSRNSTDDAYIVLRMTGFFLETVAPDLEAFKTENQHLFAITEDDDGTMFQLSQQEQYEEFSRIFDEGMMKFVNDNPYPMQDFNRILRRGLEDMKAEEDSMASLLVELLEAVADFEGFVNFMREAREEEEKEEDDGVWDMPEVPTRPPGLAESKNNDDDETRRNEETHNMK